MNRKIIILNGSPRPNGNTAQLIKAFTKGAQEVGNTVTTFFLDEMHINGCKGCMMGGKNPEYPCVQRDDMDKIYPVYMQADVVIMASPLYYWNLSGQLRTTFDRLFAVAECADNHDNPNKSCALLMSAGSDEYEEVSYYYNNLMKHLGWNNLGTVLAEDVTAIGAIEGNPILDKAYDLGKSI